MSEKQFDSFDERFREAAEQYEPPFKEASWEKMEARLNSVEKRRRRPLAGWWWFTDAVMIGIVLYLVFSITGTQKNIITNSNTLPPSSGSANKNAIQPIAENDFSSTSNKNNPSVVAGYKNAYAEPLVKDAKNDSHHSGSSSSFIQNNRSSGGITEKNKPANHSNDNYGTGKSITANETVFPGKNMTADELKKPAQQNVEFAKAQEEKEESLVAEKDVVEVVADKKTASTSEPVAPKQKDQKKTSSSKNGFFISVAAGPEWSYVWGNKPGAATLTYGGTIGYKFSKSWAVQAGIYSTSKKYGAGQGDYKPKPGTYYYNLTINHVDANCSITEIPIGVTYIIQQRSKHSLYASAGLSTLIMKEEIYNYDYLRANGQPAYYSYTYKTGNSQLFGGLLLSAGYSRKIGNGFSIAAEPFMKIPLYGVGEGSVKIGSFGTMLRLQYNLPSLRK